MTSSFGAGVVRKAFHRRLARPPGQFLLQLQPVRGILGGEVVAMRLEAHDHSDGDHPIPGVRSGMTHYFSLSPLPETVLLFGVLVRNDYDLQGAFAWQPARLAGGTPSGFGGRCLGVGDSVAQ